MSHNFEICVGASKDFLGSQPANYAHLNVLYSPFCARVGAMHHPTATWCDFAGVWLFRWYAAVWRLSERQARAARLPFLHTYEIWLRRTPTVWWKASRIIRDVNRDLVAGEVLVIPEEVEASLITAISHLLKGARDVGRWTEDCAALEALLNDAPGYLDALEHGTVPIPRFLTPQFVVPIGNR